MEGISDLPAADGLAMLAAVTPAPNQRKKEVKSTRSKEIGHWKTKAYDACQIRILTRLRFVACGPAILLGVLS